MLKYITIFLCFSFFVSSCKQKKQTETILETALSSQHPKIKQVMDSVAQYAVQIKYSQINRRDGKVYFTDYDFQADATRYFYPASTVKLPIAALALSKLNELDAMDSNTLFYIEGDSIETTITKEIQKIFALSGNDAYNRLFEFLGQDYITTKLNSKGFGPAQLSHRLSTVNAENITTLPLVIYENDSTTRILSPTINTSAKPLNLEDTEKGIGYYDDEEFISEPFDFSLKNYYPIETQHRFLKTILFPENYSDSEKINLNKNELNLVHEAMNMVPQKLDYDPSIYYDGSFKFLLYGDTKEPIPKHIKIYNTIGSAYGTLTECAYIKDTKNKVEFLVTATILVNRNTIFNDDIYEYEDIGIPFLAQLGREIYALELDRK